MNKLVVLVGLPASGKSTKVIDISEKENAIILSSDALRLELYGNENHQDNNGEVFNELYRRAKEHLRNSQSVILDATNINSKRRISVINEYKNYHKEVYYFNTRYDDCVLRDRLRKRMVGKEVISRMYKNMQIPSYKEGWDEVHLVSEEYELMKKDVNHFESIVLNPKTSHDNMFDELSQYDGETFYNIRNLPHDSKWHTLSVSRHTYEVWRYVMENYHGHDKNKMLMVALFHDTGKAHCKEFKDGSRYANFYSHENVSAQLACNFLMWLGYGHSFTLDVVELVQLHMRLLGIPEGSEGVKGTKKLIDFVGEEKYEKLKFFREADEQAK